MATRKKQNQINYGPSAGIIAGEAAVYEAESTADNAGFDAAIEEVGNFIDTQNEKTKKFEDELATYTDDIQTPENIYKIEKDNRPAVDAYVTEKTDAYAKLAERYLKGGKTDRTLFRQMEEIKYNVSGINDQLNTLQTSRVDYFDAIETGELIVDSKSYNAGMYGEMLTNKKPFKIVDDQIVFDIEGQGEVKYMDVAGKWNTKNNIGGAKVLEITGSAYNLGLQNGVFDEDGTRTAYKESFSKTGIEGIQTMAEQDVTGDDDYLVNIKGKKQKAGNLSFAKLWEMGALDDKFYTDEFKKGATNDWMFENKNSKVVNALMSQYYTDATKSRFQDGKNKYVAPESLTKTPKVVINNMHYDMTDPNNGIVKLANAFIELENGDEMKGSDGGVFKKVEGGYKKKNPMTLSYDEEILTLKQVAGVDGWRTYFNDVMELAAYDVDGVKKFK